MDIEEKKEKVTFLEKFFLKSFIWSLIILILSSILCLVLQDYQIDLAERFFSMPPHVYGKVVVMVFGIWKVLIVQFTLVPFLTLWGMRHCCCCCKDKSENK